MSPTLLIASLSLYVLSLVLSLVLALAGTRITKKALAVMAGCHALPLLLLALSAGYGEKACGVLLLTACCSALAISGAVLRSGMPLLLKIYFGLYFLTIPLFLYSPSTAIRMLTCGLPEPVSGQRHVLGNGMILEKQQGMVEPGNRDPAYKIIRDYGIFYKTLERDLRFGHTLDSAKAIYLKPDSGILVRGYFFWNRKDSLDVFSDLVPDDAVARTIYRKRDAAGIRDK